MKFQCGKNLHESKGKPVRLKGIFSSGFLSAWSCSNPKEGESGGNGPFQDKIPHANYSFQ
jgi:hypothetical protein